MIRRALTSQFEADRLQMRRACPRTISLIERAGTLTIAIQSDSIYAHQSQAPDQGTPNGPYRDRAADSGSGGYLKEAIGSDVISAIPLYTSTELFGVDDGAGRVHTKVSAVWILAGILQRTGCTVKILNFGVAGTSTADGVQNPLRSAVTSSAADLVIFHYGMNELGSAAAGGNMRTLLDGVYAANKEAIVVTPPRPNIGFGVPDADWLTTTRVLRRQATWQDANGRCAGVVDNSILYSDENLAAMGLRREDCCQANLGNHPGLREHAMTGRYTARLLLG